MLLSEALEELITETIANGRSDRTVADYNQKLAPLVGFLKNKDIGDVTARDLRNYVSYLRSRSMRYESHPTRTPVRGGLSQASVTGYLRALRRLFRFAENEGLVAQNPTTGLRVPKPKRGEPKAIATKDFARLLNAIDGDAINQRRNRAMLLLLADSAARVGGLVQIRLSDLDLEQQTVYLREKGDKGRFAFFTPITAEALEIWLEVRPSNGCDMLFVNLGNRMGEPITTQAVSQVLRRLKKRSGVTGHANPHSLRHAFAREYLKNGGNLASLADIMGHSDVQVTWQAYAVFSVEELKAAHSRYSPVANLERTGVI